MAVSFIEMKVFNFPLYAAVLAWRGKPDAKEDAVYHYVKRKLEPKGWNYYRVENTLQNGFPDIVAYKGSPPSSSLKLRFVVRRSSLTSFLISLGNRVR